LLLVVEIRTLEKAGRGFYIRLNAQTPRPGSRNRGGGRFANDKKQLNEHVSNNVINFAENVLHSGGIDRYLPNLTICN